MSVASATFRYNTAYDVYSILTRNFAIFRLGAGCHVFRPNIVKDNSVSVAPATFTYSTMYHVCIYSILTRSFAIVRLGVDYHVFRHIILKDNRCK